MLFRLKHILPLIVNMCAFLALIRKTILIALLSTQMYKDSIKSLIYIIYNEYLIIYNIFLYIIYNEYLINYMNI